MTRPRNGCSPSRETQTIGIPSAVSTSAERRMRPERTLAAPQGRSELTFRVAIQQRLRSRSDLCRSARSVRLESGSSKSKPRTADLAVAGRARGGLPAFFHGDASRLAGQLASRWLTRASRPAPEGNRTTKCGPQVLAPLHSSDAWCRRATRAQNAALPRVGIFWKRCRFRPDATRDGRRAPSGSRRGARSPRGSDIWRSASRARLGGEAPERARDERLARRGARR